jgi:rSAM/selenodomain-associated transferase 1
MASPGAERARRATVIFARAPEDEQRAKPLGPSPMAGAHVHAAGLHRKLLERTLAAAAGVADTDVYLVTTGDLECAREAALHEVPASRLVVLPQTGDTFRERFEAAVAQAFEQGHDHVVVLGSDTPELGTAELEQAFLRLEQGARTGAHAVLGPATDGGYYLLGLSAFSRAPFVDIAFGGPRVAADTVTALEQAGFTVSLLSPLRDIDDLVDVGAAAQRFKARGRPEDASLLALLLSVLATRTVLPSWHLPRTRSLVEFLPRDCRGPPSA